MTCVFSFRVRPRIVPWSYTTGVFLFPIENAVEQLKITCPKWGEEFQWLINEDCRIGVFLDEMTLEEEKLVLDALKQGYQKCCDAEYEKKYFVNYSIYQFLVEKYKELIDMIEEEIRDIERGKLILQEDGTAILNEDFKED